jgi:hypothetical protein
MSDMPAGDDLARKTSPAELEFAPLGAPAPTVRKMEYLRSFRYVFELPKWWLGLLLASICLFIPVFGVAVIAGYQYEVVEMLFRGRQLPYPLFEFKRFVPLAQRGVWLFMITMLIQPFVQLPLQFTLQFGIMGMMMLFQADPQVGAIVMAIGIPMLLLFVMICALALWMICTPLFLRVGLTQDLAQSVNLRWIQDFIRKMWREMLLSALFLLMSFCILLPIGFLGCLFGIYAVMIVYTLVSAHQQFQLYQIFIDRGGEPLPLQPLPADMPPLNEQLAP